MKKRSLRRIAAFATALALIASSNVYGGTNYNDTNFRSYENLSVNSDIPSLFKNDDIFSNYKKYPPVISDGIEYVPLEMFYGLPNVKINYSDDNSNFYIQNKQTNEYISFSIADRYAITGKNKIYRSDIPSYYGVQYVPLRAVCESVSIGCSTYNDGENKVYAIEIYTGGSSLSAEELLKIHAPELYASAEDPEKPNPPDPPQSSGIPSPPPPKPDNPDSPTPPHQDNTPAQPSTEQNKDNEGSDPKESDEAQKEPEYKKGTVKLFFTPETFRASPKTLDALDKLGIKATFFVTEENILEYPSVIRRIYTSGHTLGITFEESVETLFSQEGELEKKIRSTEDALYEVAKVKTRVMFLGDISKSSAVSEEIIKLSQNLGLCVVKLNGDSSTDTLRARTATERIKTDLTDIRKKYGDETVHLRMYHTDSAIAVTETVHAISKSNPVIRIGTFDETDFKK